MAEQRITSEGADYGYEGEFPVTSVRVTSEGADYGYAGDFPITSVRVTSQGADYGYYLTEDLASTARRRAFISSL